KWFAQAVKQAPSIPHGYFAWGAMLFAKGDLAGELGPIAFALGRGAREPFAPRGGASAISHRD
ncbi:MAG TPA: hypothetical protein VEH07_07845, partial [Alphaproteobacteria bacterium]|nr:hypothetical protein [Alphaproteobacteria bacterium]